MLGDCCMSRVSEATSAVTSVVFEKLYRSSRVQSFTVFERTIIKAKAKTRKKVLLQILPCLPDTHPIQLTVLMTNPLPDTGWIPTTATLLSTSTTARISRPADGVPTSRRRILSWTTRSTSTDNNCPGK
ncbi:hypothetical protein CEXT_228661 [Caerostris extrusa]|uniref:Uncharacterized protein n=1 Tax=Caerostris extrusa TaxID=172846 RepID=A0AAV4MIZ6_CAEEX|nr:hypothetical protein CEXT_228661 [Caerostris extrusa]